MTACGSCGQLSKLSSLSSRRSILLPGGLRSTSLWKFRGRFAAVTFNPSKRSRFGVKVYKLAASEGPSNGYICAFEIYTGMDKGDIPASQRAVIHLMEQGHERGWHSTCPLICRDVDSRSMPTGMLCMQWRDRREVTLLSTIHKREMVTTRSRRGFERIKPQVVADYNYGMNGVDTSDQLVVSYPSTRNSLKWSKKVLFNLFDMAVVNAFSLHKVLGGRLTQLIFRKKLAEDLMQLGSRRGREVRSRSRSRSPPPAPAPALSTPHGRYRRCRLYYTRGMRRMTKMMCSGCDVPLCWTSCFEEYHTMNASTSR
ncbi:piggyBac transposable element-derived protein 4-like [Penaeus vannamei]|uniref:piggyBac transposable element-derived protein 4-like n=1 Tax=Penaeus vannamei TaxID=6689 RepID=UPI00387F5222